MTWLARRRPLLHERLQPFTNLHILGGGGWEGALNFCSSLASQRGFWILPFEKWAKFNTVSIEHCVSPLSTFTHSFSVSDGGQGVSSGLRLGRTEGDPLWAAPTRLYGWDSLWRPLPDHWLKRVWLHSGLPCTHPWGTLEGRGHVLLEGGEEKAKQTERTWGMDSKTLSLNFHKYNPWKGLNICKEWYPLFGYV